LELAVSNNEFSHVDHTANFMDRRVHEIHPFVDPNARAEEMRIGEVAYSRNCKNQAVAWILSHPSRFLQLTAARFILFWFPTMLRPWQTLLIRAEALAGIVGFILFCRTANRAKWILASVWAGFPLVYYLIQAFARYRYPIDWTFVLLGAYAVLRLYHRSSAGLDLTETGAPGMAPRPGSRWPELSRVEKSGN